MKSWLALTIIRETQIKNHRDAISHTLEYLLLKKKSQAWWYMPAVLVIQETKSGRIMV
jgi:hypothetical protein